MIINILKLMNELKLEHIFKISRNDDLELMFVNF